MARDFDLGIIGPPLAIAMDFIAIGLVDMVGGIARRRSSCSATAGGHRFVLGGAWVATHWLLRESSVWRDRNTDEVRDRAAARRVRVPARGRPAGREGDPAVRSGGLDRRALRAPPPPTLRAAVACDPAARASRACGACSSSSPRTVSSSGRSPTPPHPARSRPRRARGVRHERGRYELDRVRRPQLGARRRRAARRRDAPARRRRWHPSARSSSGDRTRRRHAGARDPHPRTSSFAYDADDRPVLDDFDLTIPAGTSLAIVGQNGAGKTTLAKLLCRLYDPQRGAIEIDGVDVRELDLASWRARVTAVFQDFIRYESSLRDNVAPTGAPDDDIRAALARSRRRGPRRSRHDPGARVSRAAPTSPAVNGNASRSRVRCARCGSAPVSCCSTNRPRSSTCAAKPRSSTGSWRRRVSCTTILISHRFSTVRHADRICVLEHGRVVELGTHDELMAHHGRYRTMFDLQASRFGAEETTGDGRGRGVV